MFVFRIEISIVYLLSNCLITYTYRISFKTIEIKGSTIVIGYLDVYSNIILGYS